jgi:hypothetical protein
VREIRSPGHRRGHLPGHFAGHLYVEAPKNRKSRQTVYPRRTLTGYPLAERLAARIEAAHAVQEAGTNPLVILSDMADYFSVKV